MVRTHISRSLKIYSHDIYSPNGIKFRTDPQDVSKLQQRLNRIADEREPKIRYPEERKEKLFAREKRNLDMYEVELICLDQLIERCADIKRIISQPNLSLNA